MQVEIATVKSYDGSTLVLTQRDIEFEIDFGASPSYERRPYMEGEKIKLQREKDGDTWMMELLKQ